MPIQVYLCPDHGDWEVFTAFKDDIKSTGKCPHTLPSTGRTIFCLKTSQHVVRPIAAAIVKGGTGGGKDMHTR